eukprot:1936096-Rhodomonas_salina.1
MLPLADSLPTHTPGPSTLLIPRAGAEEERGWEWCAQRRRRDPPRALAGAMLVLHCNREKKRKDGVTVSSAITAGCPLLCQPALGCRSAGTPYTPGPWTLDPRHPRHPRQPSQAPTLDPGP